MSNSPDYTHIVGNYLARNGWKRELSESEQRYARDARSHDIMPHQTATDIIHLRRFGKLLREIEA